MEIKGKIIHVLPLQEGTSKAGNSWKKQEYVLETNDQYPKKVCFDLFGDKADQYRAEIGDDVVLSFDIESREYNGRWYTDVRAWRIEPAGQQHSQPAAAYPAHTAAPAPAPMPTVDDLSSPLTDDDLPF